VLSNATAAICVVPLRRVMVPVGATEPVDGVTLATNETLAPATAVVGVTMSAVVVVSAVTVSVCAAEVLPE
jgi:hypothetical protein